MTMLRRLNGRKHAGAGFPGDRVSDAIRKVYVTTDSANEWRARDYAEAQDFELEVVRNDRDITGPVDGDLIVDFDHPFFADHEPLVRLCHKALGEGYRVAVQTYFAGHPALQGVLSRPGVVAAKTFRQAIHRLRASSAATLSYTRPRA